jgi:hypothetical protein
MRKVALVEAVNPIPHRHHRGEYFPYLLALTRDLGWEGRWWVVPVALEDMHAGSRYTFELTPKNRSLMLEQLVSYAPDVVVFNDRPSHGVLADIRNVLSRVVLVDIATAFGWRSRVRDAIQLLSGQLPEDIACGSSDQFLLDLPSPCFQYTCLRDSTSSNLTVARTLACVQTCCYRRSLRHNPYYESVASDVVANHLGCAFCGMDTTGIPLRTPPIPLLMRQIEAHQQQASAEGPPYRYNIPQSEISSQLVRFLDEVIQRRVAPSQFTTMVRVDLFLAQLEGLRCLMPAMESAGHRLTLVSMGGENFSDEENGRLNKGLTSQQLLSCYTALRELEESHPRAFSYSDTGFSAILFTPWTTPEDLRKNLSAARVLGESWLKTVLGTRLQLWDGTPITELARHDGLLADRFASPGDIEALCISSPDQRELPWRFLDPVMERIHSLVIRLAPRLFQARFDPEAPDVTLIQAEQKQLESDWDMSFIDVVEAIVNTVERLGPSADHEQIFGAIRAQGIQRTPPSPPVTAGATLRVPPGLVVTIRRPGSSGPAVAIRVMPIRTFQGSCQRIGNWACTQSGPPPDARIQRFLQLLQMVMRLMDGKPFGPRSAVSWRNLLSQAAEEAGLANRLDWTVEWEGSGRM